MNIAILTSITVTLASNPCRTGDVDDDELDRRIAKAESVIDAHDGNLGLWFGAIFGVHSAVMLGAIAIANASDDDGVKKEMFTAAVGSALGIITLTTGRPPLIDADGHLAGIDEKKQRLAMLEYLLEKSARKITFTQSWISHTASFLYSLGASLVLWFAFDRKRAAITQFIGGQIIGQGRILVQPTGAVDGWDDYRGEYLEGCGEPVKREETSAIAIEPAGLGFTVRW